MLNNNVEKKAFKNDQWIKNSISTIKLKINDKIKNGRLILKIYHKKGLSH